MTAHARFIQITAGPSVLSAYDPGGLYALDEQGVVWVYMTDEHAWRALSVEREP